jgi:CD2 antigen cytoplasmic tail-binding protein 2
LSSAAASVSVDMNLNSLQASSSGEFSGTTDIFREDNEAVAQDSVSNQTIFQGKALQSTNSFGSNTFAGGVADSDYVYDESLGYYYSSQLGYYYDTTTGLF